MHASVLCIKQMPTRVYSKTDYENTFSEFFALLPLCLLNEALLHYHSLLDPSYFLSLEEMSTRQGAVGDFKHRLCEGGKQQDQFE